jgi:ABC-type cobalt transport system substrate-binding protein
MKIPLYIGKNLVKLSEGQILPFSTVKHPIIENLIQDGVLRKNILSPKKATVQLNQLSQLNHYLNNHFGIENIAQYVLILEKEDATRAEAIDAASDSKLKNIRTFKGFLVNCYEPIDGILNGQLFAVQPNIGAFTFIYDFKNYIPAPDVTIVGVENPENFRFVERQKALFQGIKPLFVSRYPQHQSNDLRYWLERIPNPYWHFGDFDFAGLNIYWNEFKVHLQERAQFYLPEDVEIVLEAKGKRALYDIQKIQFDENQVLENNILKLLKMIRQHKKGLEQEIYVI